MKDMKATVRAQLPLQPPPPEPGLPQPPAPVPVPVIDPPVLVPVIDPPVLVPVIDPPVPGQGDPVREPPTAEASPITPLMAVPTRIAMRRFTPYAQAPALTGGGLRTSAGATRC